MRRGQACAVSGTRCFQLVRHKSVFLFFVGKKRVAFERERDEKKNRERETPLSRLFHFKYTRFLFQIHSFPFRRPRCGVRPSSASRSRSASSRADPSRVFATKNTTRALTAVTRARARQIFIKSSSGRGGLRRLLFVAEREPRVRRAAPRLPTLRRMLAADLRLAQGQVRPHRRARRHLARAISFPKDAQRNFTRTLPLFQEREVRALFRLF